MHFVSYLTVILIFLTRLLPSVVLIVMVAFPFFFALILLPETMATTFGLLDENCKVLFVAFVGRIVVAILNDFPTFIVYAFFLRRRDLTGTFFATTVMLAVAV